MALDRSGLLGRKNSFAREQLFVDAASGKVDVLDLYIARFGDLDSKDEDGLALIHHAACHGNIAFIRQLKERGADLNLLDGGSPPWKPIHYAIFHRQHAAEQVLRTLGAEVPLPILQRVAFERLRETPGEREAKAVLTGRTRSMASPQR